MTIDPTADQVRALRDGPAKGPIVMVNMLKFRDRAAYPTDYAGGEDTDVSGADAYARYQHAFTVTVGATSKAEVLYEGPVQQVFIGAEGASDTDWDKMLIVRYPDKKNFLNMMANEEYRGALVHRYAGLERTVLLQCEGD
ncbi:MAG: DUF1330 domain-containing protein [Pacificimonas sp.]|jgi:hypothetical protein|nr:DUF1330 domain-containing protein [Pacificimonas sp.]